MSKRNGILQPLENMNTRTEMRQSEAPIYNSCFLDLSTAVLTTSRKLMLWKNLEIPRGHMPIYQNYAENTETVTQLNHYQDFSQQKHCPYQPVHGKNNLIIHGCKDELRLYDCRMPLKGFCTIKLSEGAVPNSIHLDDRFVTCSLIPWNQQNNNKESVLSLFDLRNLACLDQMDFNGPFITPSIPSNSLRFVKLS